MKVFLSHAAEDRRFARDLRGSLNELGLEVWDPTIELPHGSNWLLETGRALQRADVLVFLFSDAAARSEWARREVEYAIGQPKFEGKVVSVRLSLAAELPWILERLSVVDATDGDARMAAKKVVSALRSSSVVKRRRAQKARPDVAAKLAKSS